MALECGTDSENFPKMNDLTGPQAKMLIQAAKSRRGRASIGTGQSSTAKALAALELGSYVQEAGASASGFWIWPSGIALARKLDPGAVAWGEKIRRSYGEPHIP